MVPFVDERTADGDALDVLAELGRVTGDECPRLEERTTRAPAVEPMEQEVTNPC